MYRNCDRFRKSLRARADNSEKTIWIPSAEIHCKDKRKKKGQLSICERASYRVQ